MLLFVFVFLSLNVKSCCLTFISGLLYENAVRDSRTPKCWGTDSPSNTVCLRTDNLQNTPTSRSLSVLCVIQKNPLWYLNYTLNWAVRFHYGSFGTLSVIVLTSHKDTRLKAPLGAFRGCSVYYTTKYKWVKLNKQHTNDFAFLTRSKTKMESLSWSCKKL